MLVLFIPWLLFALCVVALLCLLKRWYWVGGLLLLVVLFMNWHWQVFAFGCKTLSDKKEEGVLRVMTWNVDSSTDGFDERVDDIYACVQEYEPDVLFLTEYNLDLRPRLDSLLRVHYDYEWGRTDGFSCSMLYSKARIVRCGFVDEEQGSMVTIANASIEWQCDSINVFAGHMASNNTSTTAADSIDTANGIKLYLTHYEKKAKEREYDANTIVSQLWNRNTIVMGDLNDVMCSAPMEVFANAGLVDAWWNGGFGYGASFHNPMPYRIDHVMYSDGLKLKGIG